MRRRPTDSVRIVIFDEEKSDYFYVLTEADDPDNWKLPGGKFEKGKSGAESAFQAAYRELEEEVGLTKDKVKLYQADTLVNDDGKSARYIFAARTDMEMLQPTGEVAKSQWFTEDSLPQCKNHKHIVDAAAVARYRLKYET